MLGVIRNVKAALTKPYLTTSGLLTRCLLGGRTAKRDFSRIVIVAALGRNFGIGSGARLQWAALRRLGINAHLLDATPALRNPLFRVQHEPGSVYIFHADGPDTASLIRSVLPHVAHAYRIGYWAWELPDPPHNWAASEHYIDEIWTPSRFSRDSLMQLFNCRVEVVPHTIPRFPMRNRNTDRPFTVLTMADSRSSLSRKNPEGALRAFRTAFGTSSAARLIVKLSGRPQDVRALEVSLGDLIDCGNVEILHAHLDNGALAALYDRTDVLLSLHRAEGFGLTMAEAMAHGVPVVGTGWSGNLDFMSEADSCLVPYHLIPVDDAASIYAGSTWADPDVDAAANALNRLFLDKGYYAQIAAAGHRRASRAEPHFPFIPVELKDEADAFLKRPAIAMSTTSSPSYLPDIYSKSTFSPR